MSRDRTGGLARRLAGRLGLDPRHVRVEAAGLEGEVAVVTVPRAALPALLDAAVRLEVVERARAAGFRHAAVDLALGGPAGGSERNRGTGAAS